MGKSSVGELEGKVHQGSSANIDCSVVQSAYDWTISDDGEVLGLIAGDLGYERTGIKLSGETLEIWRLGVKAYMKAK